MSDFDIFGVDSESDGESDRGSSGVGVGAADATTTAISEGAKVRVEEAGRRREEQRRREEAARQERAAGGDGYAFSFIDPSDDAYPRPPLTAVFPHHPPLFTGPITLQENLASMGGGRGFVAACDLPAGSVLMREVAAVPWSAHDQEETMAVRAVAKIGALLSGLEAGSEEAKVLESMKALHPVDLEREIPESAVQAMRVETGLTSNFELRLFFTFSCNAYDSGLYFYFSLFNHSESPNCYKFSPRESEGINYSEMRTTRSVRAGELDEEKNETSSGRTDDRRGSVRLVVPNPRALAFPVRSIQCRPSRARSPSTSRGGAVQPGSPSNACSSFLAGSYFQCRPSPRPSSFPFFFRSAPFRLAP